ncbi:hypothetical protein CDAR_45451 [Caerostris darwini]|uniref:Secreted protein n=1 Tax=Caerostris darwini TaxID=1538125 RepID=A0AAV4M2E8_9ARAC|nr:hypothetical protein CDAR_45451 [Caerostris darwini]
MHAQLCACMVCAFICFCALYLCVYVCSSMYICTENILKVPDPGTAPEASTFHLTAVPVQNSEADICQQTTAAEQNLKERKKLNENRPSPNSRS